MNIVRSLRPLSQNASCNFYRNFRISGSNFDSSQAPAVKEEKFDFEDINVLERVERRKPPIPPFMKNAMVSVFDRELLAYPEVLNKEETEAVDARSARITNFLASEGNNQNVLDQMCRAPFKLTDGGLAINVTERIRYIESLALSGDLKLTKTLSDHWVALEALKLGLKAPDLQKLVPELSKGDKTVSLCIKEKIAIRPGQEDFRTHAKQDKDGTWLVTGEKICYNKTGYYLVLSTTQVGRLKAFLVLPNAEGIVHKDNVVNFFNTPSIILSEVSEKALSSVFALSRVDTAVTSYSILRKLINDVIKYVRGKYITGKPLAEVPTIKANLGEGLLTLYAAESMAYFTAGLLDNYHDPEADMEMAMCRTFIAEHGLQTIITLLTIPGLEAINEYWSSYFDDFRRLTVRDEINENVNLFIALTGIENAGKILGNEVKQIRNPLFNPSFIFKKVLADRHQEADNPKLTLHLSEHLHPSLQQSAAHLEYSVLRMRFACEAILSRHGLEVSNAWTELERLARAGTEILAMSSVLARSSRSYCTGIRNSEVEMKLASCFVETSRNRLQRLILDVVNGEYLNLDHFRDEFGRKMLDSASTVIERPTERVIW